MASYDPYAVYGALASQNIEQGEAIATNVKPPYFGRKRMKLNIVAIFVCLFVPWLLFTLLFADVSFRLHYKQPAVCWSLVALAVLFALCTGSLAQRNISQLYQESWHRHQPSWYVFLFLTSLAAVVLGTALGSMNFWQNMSPYYDLRNLNDYSYVDPARTRGEQMMDAGRVDFVSGAVVDVSKAYAFQNSDTYCVAPITVCNSALGCSTPLNSYDFWAVGMNCCGGNSTHQIDFRCVWHVDALERTKEFGVRQSQGLRLISAEQRPFFRLAVQQAEAAHMIKSDHPLFFYWTDDAVELQNSYLEDAFKMFASWMCGVFLVQLCLVLIKSYIVSSIGHANM